MRTKLISTVVIALLIVLTGCSANQEATQQEANTGSDNQTVSIGDVQTTATALSALFANTSTPGTISSSPSMTAVTLPQTGGGMQAEESDMAYGRTSDGSQGGQPIAMMQFNGTGTVALASGDSMPGMEAQMQNVPVDDVDSDDDEVEAPETMLFEDYGVNPFFDTAQDNLSTFAMDVDTGSYTLARSYLMDYNQLPPPESVRVEEFINYFPQQYDAPTDGSAFSINMTASPSPFSEDGQILLRVGVQGRVVAAEDRDPALLIFVIDVSGSMDQTNRLYLAKEALTILVGELREDDRVGIVIYANEARVVLEPTPASEQQTIIAAIDSLQTEGSTYAEAGLRLGYQMAQAQMRDGQITRVILVSDGVANVGETGPAAILETISDGVESGITLSTIGVGMGNFNDVLMEQLANDGNGNYHYVDNIREARRIFVNNLTSTLQVIGYDARIQVEFNPDVVARYRLIGYENRDIADELFRDDTVDAGEVGAGHTITALYELELVDNAQSGTVATAYLRYLEDADSEEGIEINQTFDMADIIQSFADSPADFQITAVVAEFSEILRGSPYGTSDFDALSIVLEGLASNYPAAAEINALIARASNLS